MLRPTSRRGAAGQRQRQQARVRAGEAQQRDQEHPEAEALSDPDEARRLRPTPTTPRSPAMPGTSGEWPTAASSTTSSVAASSTAAHTPAAAHAQRPIRAVSVREPATPPTGAGCGQYARRTSTFRLALEAQERQRAGHLERPLHRRLARPQQQLTAAFARAGIRLQQQPQPRGVDERRRPGPRSSAPAAPARPPPGSLPVWRAPARSSSPSSARLTVPSSTLDALDAQATGHRCAHSAVHTLLVSR